MIVISIYENGHAFTVCVDGIRMYSGDIYDEVIKIINSRWWLKETLLRNFCRKYNKTYDTILWCEDGAVICNGKHIE